MVEAGDPSCEPGCPAFNGCCSRQVDRPGYLRWINDAGPGKGISCSIATKKPPGHPKELQMPTCLKDFATAVVAVVEPETSGLVCAQLMRKHHVGALVVVDAAEKSRPVGILTDRDLVLALMAEELDPAVFTAGDIMSVGLVQATPEMDAMDAVALMRRHRLRRLVIVDEAGRLTGVVTMEDILVLLTRELADLAAGVVGARDREFEQRA